ncbi:ABC transporter permease [Labrys wisconsinensis]|uniref:Spermidine/putrescine transport system permease protein n=1 Tax=Labrys wisconsinensis TaxID=425677 RepID=A0ABU0J8F0_9HYPH|nr:ABC transporter permease [Labrys wisconsinensis]MDQ0470559.1 putative spermidine/putrescine transport system permease protein [Labrys wisconsinensis]
MTTAFADIADHPADDSVALPRRLRRLRRRGQAKALLLVAPLLLFLLAVFVVPIGALLTRSVDNSVVRQALPQTAVALAAWDGESVPDEAVYAAFAADLKASPRETVAEVAKRLNYYEAGLRSMLLKTGRQIGRAQAPWHAAFVAIDPAWGTPRYWRVLRQALPATTDFYLLAALDLQHDDRGAIVGVTPETAVHRQVLLRTFAVSLSVTLICLALGYPLAALIARSRGAVANTLLILVLLPFWTSLLVRTSAWVVLLQSRGVVNEALAWLGLIDPARPLDLIYNRTGVLIAMTHILLPFMVLPIYSVMKGIPPVYLRAAASLGAPPASAFRHVYLPMSLPGVSAGCLLVFILALGYYITPALVGGPQDQMVSYFIAYYANQVTNWGMAAALSAILLVAVLILYAVYNRIVGIDRLRMG